MSHRRRERQGADLSRWPSASRPRDSPAERRRYSFAAARFGLQLRVSGRAGGFGPGLISFFRIPAARCGLVCVPLRVRRVRLSSLRAASRKATGGELRVESGRRLEEPGGLGTVLRLRRLGRLPTREALFLRPGRRGWRLAAKLRRCRLLRAPARIRRGYTSDNFSEDRERQWAVRDRRRVGFRLDRKIPEQTRRRSHRQAPPERPR